MRNRAREGTAGVHHAEPKQNLAIDISSKLPEPKGRGDHMRDGDRSHSRFQVVMRGKQWSEEAANPEARNRCNAGCKDRDQADKFCDKLLDRPDGGPTVAPGQADKTPGGQKPSDAPAARDNRPSGPPNTPHPNR